MIRSLNRAVVVLVLSIFLGIGCLSYGVKTSEATPIDSSPQIEIVPESPFELPFMQEKPVLGMSGPEADALLGSGAYKTDEEFSCSVPLIEIDQATNQAMIIDLQGQGVRYKASNFVEGWRIERVLCFLNEVVVSDKVSAKWVAEGTQLLQASQTISDFELTRQVFWGDYEGDYRLDHLLKKNRENGEKEL